MLLRDLRVYSFCFLTEEKNSHFQLASHQPICYFKTLQEWVLVQPRNLPCYYSTKWKGFGFQTDRKSFLYYVVSYLNFNRCIKKWTKIKNVHPQERARTSLWAESTLWFLLTFQRPSGKSNWPRVSVPRPHVNNCVQNTLLGWAEPAVPPNTTLTESAWNPISSLRSGGTITPEQSSGLFYHTQVVNSLPYPHSGVS